jgi:hypothetical protein
VRATFRWKRPKSRKKLLAAMRIDTLARNQSSKSAHHFHVEQVRNKE